MYSALVISLSPNDKYMMSMRENEWWIIALWQFWYWMVQHFEIDHMLIDHNQIVGLVWQTWTLNDWVILRSVCHSVSVIWPKYCRCGLKHYIINQSINHWAIWPPFKKKYLLQFAIWKLIVLLKNIYLKAMIIYLERNSVQQYLNYNLLLIDYLNEESLAFNQDFFPCLVAVLTKHINSTTRSYE